MNTHQHIVGALLTACLTVACSSSASAAEPSDVTVQQAAKVNPIRSWNRSGPEPFDLSVFVQYELGRIYFTGESEFGHVSGIDLGGEVRAHDRLGIGFDYVSSDMDGINGQLYTPYVFADLRPRATHLRVQPFVSAGAGLMALEGYSNTFTAHAGAGVRVQLARHVGIRADIRLNQPMQDIYQDGNTTYSLPGSELHLVQSRLGLYGSW